MLCLEVWLGKLFAWRKQHYEKAPPMIDMYAGGMLKAHGNGFLSSEHRPNQSGPLHFRGLGGTCQSPSRPNRPRSSSRATLLSHHRVRHD